MTLNFIIILILYLFTPCIYMLIWKIYIYTFLCIFQSMSTVCCCCVFLTNLGLRFVTYRLLLLRDELDLDDEFRFLRARKRLCKQTNALLLPTVLPRIQHSNIVKALQALYYPSHQLPLSLPLFVVSTMRTIAIRIEVVNGGNKKLLTH